MKVKALFLLIILTGTMGSLFGQETEPFTAILKKLEAFTEKHRQEKVHLHLDKPYYAIGDDIWFKAYTIDAKTGLPTTISNILYVELIGGDNAVKSRLRLPMQNGTAWGDFSLPDTLTEGNYRIRAYTQWMRNAGPWFFFDRTIKIGNSWANKVFANATFHNSGMDEAGSYRSTVSFRNSDSIPYSNQVISYEVRFGTSLTAKGRLKTDSSGNIAFGFDRPKDANANGQLIVRIEPKKGETVTKTIPIKVGSAQLMDVQLLPEGGTCVQGLPNKIAIKAIDANGLGKDVKGSIIDDLGTEVGTFETKYLGMGTCYLVPIAGRSYSARIRLADGSEKRVPFPKASTSGYLLSVNAVDSLKISIKIMLSKDLLNKGPLNLLAHRSGNVYLNLQVPTGKQVSTIVLDKKEFPSGILQFTLFSPENIPMCERLAFVYNTANQINIGLKPLLPTHTKRGKVDMLITGSDKNKLASFSVAVTNTSIVAPDLENESNILTSLLLTSDLVGYVERPNHYFLADNLTTRTELDNLLLTQGWRKVDWQQIGKQDPQPSAFRPETQISISGRIVKKGRPMPNSRVMLTSNKEGFFVTDTITDAKGHFAFENLVFNGRTKFLLKARSEENKKTVQIEVDSIPEQQVTPNINLPDLETNINTELQAYLKQNDNYLEEQVKEGFLKHSIALKMVEIKAKPNPAKNSVNLNGAGNADYVFDGDDMVASYTIESFLHGKIAGVMFYKGRAYRGSISSGPDMKFMVDGNFMDDDFRLYDIQPYDVESIEVLTSIGKRAIYGQNSGSGIIMITTRKGPINWPIVKYAPGITTIEASGYYAARTFYSPVYDVDPSDRPDLRSTVYWEPNLVANEKGEFRFGYFNTGQPGDYRIVVEGIGADGKLARKTINYQVD